MCKSVYNFLCHHLAVAEPIRCVKPFTTGNCPCGRFREQRNVTFLCPACKLFKQAEINPTQLTWLIEQQENTAHSLIDTDFGLSAISQQKKTTQLPTEPKAEQGKPPAPEPMQTQNPPVVLMKNDAKPRTYAAAVRGNQQQGRGGNHPGTGLKDDQEYRHNRGRHGGKKWK
ncbi:hypothetical protein H072_7414 [Dactylellina haptotyla CBS 200.50]|uniref:Uncharacterized protein n=1 Tax=Dactylellina haptotyla (strain CBS 200.50) TaxID=1284197 RepID=S8A799_DACHA|nr:hypothetical protein H072_7414 [Dactylellina haptotyla CBS 200.50]